VKALAIDGYGFEHVQLTDVAEPEPGPGEVLVRVRAAALNRLDLWTLSGDLKIEHDFPHVLGADGAGEIAAVGHGVTGLKEGAAVFINPGISCGSCEFCRAGEQSLCPTFSLLGEHRSGTLAEFVKVPAANVFPLPGHLSFSEAAALGLTAITAYRMLFARAAFKPGEWILVTGIGGGLALALLMLARPVAGRLYVTSSSSHKIDRALEMGADAGVNYKDEDVGKAIRRLTAKRGVDLVADSAGGPSLDGSLRALASGGRVVIAGATTGGRSEINVRRLFWSQLQIIGSTMGSNDDVSNMLRMVAGTELRPLIDRSYPLAGAADALRYLESGEQFGKVVVEVA
jgi:NADPH:quinone reductase-like Zn-dependent oxidoreductase